MNEELRSRGESVAEMPQCLKGPTEPCESKEQREQRRRIEFLKNWRIEIQILDRGCTVSVGCKSIAFTSIEAGYREIGHYLENPQLVANEYGFLNHI